MMLKFFTAIIAAVLLCGSVWAHSGGTDKNGCHKERRTGTKHCH